LNREDIIRIARQAGVRDDEHRFEFSEYKYLERFAALVIANHPPQSFMTWQEGYAAGTEAGQRTFFSKAEYTIGIDTTDGIHTVVVLRNTPGQPTTVVASQRLPEKHS
jgi:hypothetical protein